MLRNRVSLGGFVMQAKLRAMLKRLEAGFFGDRRSFVRDLSRQGLSATLEEHATKAGPLCSAAAETLLALRSRFTPSLAPPWRRGIPNRACWPDCTATRREDPWSNGATVGSFSGA